MTDFSPDTCVFNDVIGLSAWRIGHQREHSSFVVVLARQTPPILMPDYPLIDIGADKGVQQTWLDEHSRAHSILRSVTNVNGIDLADVDLHDSEQWYIWVSAHALEHQELRAALGLT